MGVLDAIESRRWLLAALGVRVSHSPLGAVRGFTVDKHKPGGILKLRLSVASSTRYRAALLSRLFLFHPTESFISSTEAALGWLTRVAPFARQA